MGVCNASCAAQKFLFGKLILQKSKLEFLKIFLLSRVLVLKK